jgi:hypothetical protein
MLAGFLLLAGLLSAPPVQSWIVRRLVATQPGWTVSFHKFGVTPGGVEAGGVDFAMPGISAQTAPVAIRIAPLRLFSRRELRLERVEAQKLNVILTPAQLASTPAGPASAPPFDGALRLLQSPVSWAIDTAEVDGQITVNDGGQSVVVGDFSVEGGGISAAQTGEFTYRLAVNSALLPLAPDNKVRSSGTIRVTQTKTHGVASIAIEGELVLPHYGPLVLPTGKLTLIITATAGGEEYHAKLDFGAAGEMEFNGRLENAQSLITGRLAFRADQSLAASLEGEKLPAAEIQGGLDVVLDLHTNDLQATLTSDFTGSDWGRLRPEFAVLDALRGRVEAELIQRGGKLLLKKFAATLQGAATPIQASVVLIKPVDPLQLSDLPLARIELAHGPAEWANPWVAANGLILAGGEFSGSWNLRLPDHQALRLEPLTHATFGPTTISYDPMPPLRDVSFTLSPVLTVSAQQVDLAVSDFSLTTPTHDRIDSNFTASSELATGKLTTAGSARASLPGWLAPAGEPPPFMLDTDWDASLTGDILQLKTFALTARRNAITAPCFAVQLLRPLRADLGKLIALPEPGAADDDWLRLRFDGLPLDWAARWLDLAVPGAGIAGTFATGESLLRPSEAGGFAFTTVQPWRLTGAVLTLGGKALPSGEFTVSPSFKLQGDMGAAVFDQISLRDTEGNQITGRITADATLHDKKVRSTIDLVADLPALPRSVDSFGALTATLHAETHNESDALVWVDALDLRVLKSDRELLTLQAPAPFLFGLSNAGMFTFSTLTPLRLTTGEIPLGWLQSFADGLTLDGTLQPADFVLGAHLTNFQLRPLKPLRVHEFAARRGDRELARAMEFSAYPGLDLTCIFIPSPKLQLAYSGTAHLTDGTLDVGDQTIANLELALSFIGNDEVILPSGIELSSRLDFAPLVQLAAFRGTGLPSRGTFTSRLNGDMLGEAPLESWSRLEGVPTADGQRLLPALEVTARGKVSKASTFAADVTVRYATTPQPTDANFDVTFDMRDANLHIASGFHSTFLDARELLALAEAFQPAATPTSAKATGTPVAAIPAKGRVYQQDDTPFWSALRGYFDLDLGTVQFAPYRIDHVRGRLDIGDTDLRLSNLSGEMFAGRWGGQLRVDYKQHDQVANHWLVGDFHIEQFESARVVQTVFPNQVASVDALINVHSTLASRGNALFELIERSEGAFTIEGEDGVMRLNVP